MSLRKDIGIDLGTATVLVYIKGKGIVLNEPSVVAVDVETNKVVAVGETARRMIGKTPGNIVAIRPLRGGVISNYDYTEKMIKYFIEKASGKMWIKFFGPQIMICVPSGVTQVEERAVLQASKQVGAKKTYIISEPKAAAIGAGLDVTKPCGSMVVDIGGGTTDVAVISMGDIVVSESIRIAGDDFDDSVSKYIKKKYNMAIGESTAEELKKEIGTVYPPEEEKIVDVRGRDLVTGLPTTIKVSNKDMYEALKDCAERIVEAVHTVLENTPPELSGDLKRRGIVLTGGGSLIRGLDKLIHDSTDLDVVVAEDPLSCVARGTGIVLDYID